MFLMCFRCVCVNVFLVCVFVVFLKCFSVCLVCVWCVFSILVCFWCVFLFFGVPRVVGELGGGSRGNQGGRGTQPCLYT